MFARMRFPNGGDVGGVSGVVSAGAKRPSTAPSAQSAAARIQGRSESSSRIAPSASPASASVRTRSFPTPIRTTTASFRRAPVVRSARRRILHRLERRRQDGSLPSRPRVVRPLHVARALQQGAVRPAQGRLPRASPPHLRPIFHAVGARVPRPGTRRPHLKPRRAIDWRTYVFSVAPVGVAMGLDIGLTSRARLRHSQFLHPRQDVQHPVPPRLRILHRRRTCLPQAHRCGARPHPRRISHRTR